MIKHEEVKEDLETLEKRFPVLWLRLRSYLNQQEKKDELLELKDREIKLLKARLTYNDNDECQDVLFFENSNALEYVRDKIIALEDQLK